MNLKINWLRFFKIGDIFIILFFIIFTASLFNIFWTKTTKANQVKISAMGKDVLIKNLNQTETLKIQGKLGISLIYLDSVDKRVKIIQDPSPKQYCVLQGWLTHAGDIAVCLPNQISVELINSFQIDKQFDSITY